MEFMANPKDDNYLEKQDPSSNINGIFDNNITNEIKDTELFT